MIDEEDNLYVHMTSDGEDAPDLTVELPAPVSPSFSLAYLRRSRDPVALLTTEGRITFLNDPARIFLGLASVEIAQGRDLWEYWGDSAEGDIQDAVIAGANAATQTLPVACPVSQDGVKRHALMTSPVIDTDGRVESVFVVITDPD